LKIVAACLMILLLAGCGTPAPTTSMAPPRESRLSHQPPAVPPYAFTHFCLRYAEECRVRDAAFEDDHDEWSELADVNMEVNSTITPHANAVAMNYDTWRISPRSGDCNDYAVTKRHELLGLGWPSRSLLLAEAVTPKGEHHLVLVVRSGSRNLVLDNLTSEIKDQSETPYQWVRMQSPDNPKVWTEG